MENEEKTLKNDTKTQTADEKIAQRLAALAAIYNSTVDEEEPEATAKFFKLMDEQTARKAAAW